MNAKNTQGSWQGKQQKVAVLMKKQKIN